MNFKTYLEQNDFDNSDPSFINLAVNKDTRLKFGDKAEEFIYNDLVNKGINVKSVKQSEKYTRKMDLNYGDLYFPDTKKYIDVKLGRAVSEKSLNSFKGEGFLFAIGVPPKGGNVTEDKIWFIKADVLKDIVNSMENKNLYEKHKDAKDITLKKDGEKVAYAILPSKETGYYFNFNLIPQKIKYTDIINLKLRKV